MSRGLVPSAMETAGQRVEHLVEYMPDIQKRIESDPLKRAAFQYGFAEGYNKRHYRSTMGIDQFVDSLADDVPFDPMARQLRESHPEEYFVGSVLGGYAQREDLVR